MSQQPTNIAAVLSNTLQHLEARYASERAIPAEVCSRVAQYMCQNCHARFVREWGQVQRCCWHCRATVTATSPAWVLCSVWRPAPWVPLLLDGHRDDCLRRLIPSSMLSTPLGEQHMFFCDTFHVYTICIGCIGIALHTNHASDSCTICTTVYSTPPLVLSNDTERYRLQRALEGAPSPPALGSLTRVLGMTALKPTVSAEATVVRLPLTSDTQQLILASPALATLASPMQCALCLHYYSQVCRDFSGTHDVGCANKESHKKTPYHASSVL